MNDTFTVSVRAEEIISRLRGAGDRMQQAVERAVTRLSITLQSKTKVKLSGPVLHNRTGTLRRSINREVFVRGSTAEAVVGTNVIYAGVHEFGFDDTVTVRGHVRKNARAVGSGRANAPDPAERVSFVCTHTRHMHMPQRSYLRSTLREMEDEIRTDIRSAALGALQ